MIQDGDSRTIYLNRDGRWPDFQLLGIDRDKNGAIALTVLPAAENSVIQPAATEHPPNGPSGVAVDISGRVYFCDTEANRVFSIDPCDSAITVFSANDASSHELIAFNKPRGLAIHEQLNALLIADSGNHEIKLLDLEIPGRQVGTWKDASATDRPFEPQSLAVDSQGNTYAVDIGAHRVLKFDSNGNEITDFWQNAMFAWDKSGGSGDRQPSEVTVFESNNGISVFVLDAQQSTLFVFDAGGHLNEKIDLKTFDIDQPIGLAITKGAIYIGDNQRQRISKLQWSSKDGEPIQQVGMALGYHAFIAAMAADPKSQAIWVHPGAQGPPVKLVLGGGFVDHGVFWSGPINVSDRPTNWHRLKALGCPVKRGAHFRFFIYTSEDENQGPLSPTFDNKTFQTDPSQPNSWRGLPADLDDVLIGEASRFLWIGGKLEGDGRHSPRLEQIRLNYDHTTYTQYLPEIYRSDSPNPNSLDRFLALFESFFDDVEQAIERLDHYFDTQAVPTAWLDWLAGWLGLELKEEWTENKKRQAITRAFEIYAWRGTAKGLRQALKFYADVDAQIEEPLLNADWWILPATKESLVTKKSYSVLGVNTRLVAAEAQGAVVGTTAVLDHSHLIREEQFGAPLFEPLAHRFSVHVHQSQVKTPEKLNEVKEIIEREKPAHTAYKLCVIRPELRIGLQSTVGIDTVVAGPQQSKLEQTESATNPSN